MAVIITSSNFDSEVLQSPIPVLLDFWAEWCVPCKMLSPIIEQVGEEHAGQIKIGKVNIDEEPALAEQHSVVSIPSLFLYKDGQIASKIRGAIPKVKVEEFIKDFVS
jgi:thioredoxin 1